MTLCNSQNTFRSILGTSIAFSWMVAPTSSFLALAVVEAVRCTKYCLRTGISMRSNTWILRTATLPQRYPPFFLNTIRTVSYGQESYMEEIALLSKLRGYECIIKMVDHQHSIEENSLNIVLELAEIDLAKLLQRHPVWASYLNSFLMP